MRFEVPQFIEVEDKIFGPLTWKQFIYIAGGAGAAVILYFLLPTILFVIIGLPVMTLAGFLAFHQVNNQPFSIFLESALSYFTNRKLYLWKKEKEQVIKAPLRETPGSEPSVPPKGATKGGIAALSQKLELNSLEETE